MFEQYARFLVSKYGVPNAFATHQAARVDIATIMVILGLAVFAAVLIVLFRDWQALQEASRARTLE